jgi:hypothetical protein
MKKFIAMAIVAVISCFAFCAAADGMPGIPVILKFDLIYQVQGSNTYTTSTSGTVTKYVNKTLKGDKIRITSKDIIQLIESVFETNFPDGSQLALYLGNIVIVDADDNVIFYPNEATPPASSDWGFYSRIDRPVEWGKDVSNSLGDDNEDFTMRAVFHMNLYNYPGIETLSAKATDLSTDSFDLALGGLLTQDYSYTRDHEDSSWKEKVSGKLTGIAGDGSTDNDYGILTGSAKLRGSAKGSGKD